MRRQLVVSNSTERVRLYDMGIACFTGETGNRPGVHETHIVWRR